MKVYHPDFNSHLSVFLSLIYPYNVHFPRLDLTDQPADIKLYYLVQYAQQDCQALRVADTYGSYHDLMRFAFILGHTRYKYAFSTALELMLDYHPALDF